MTKRLLAGIVCSLAVVGCGGGGGGGGDGGGGGGGGGGCTDIFTTAATYLGKEDVAGCYTFTGVDVTANVSQTAGTCNAEIDLHTSSASHTCPGTLSGNASSGYNLSFTCTGDGYHGTVHFEPDLSTLTGSFDWTYSPGCTGTTTFEPGMTKQ